MGLGLRLLPLILVLAVTSLVPVGRVEAQELQPPPLPQPKQGAMVYSAGGVLKNISNTDAEDVHIGLRIPSFWGGENINQGSLIFGIDKILSQVVQFGNQFSSTFDKDYLFENFKVAPNGTLKLSGLIDSKKANALKWGDNYLTDKNGNKLPTKFYDGSIKVESQSPLTYTFGSDSNVMLRVDRIGLGWTTTLVDVEAFSLGSLNDLAFFDNGGTGWVLSPGQEIPITLPFDLPAGGFVVADVVGTGDPGGPDELPVHFLQQHEDNRHLVGGGGIAEAIPSSDAPAPPSPSTSARDYAAPIAAAAGVAGLLAVVAGGWYVRRRLS